VSGGVDVLRGVLQHLADANITVVDAALRRPTLDDVFLSLTGHHAEEPTNGNGAEPEAEATVELEQEKEAVR
jgi:ABC-2 type transport system ATP-binding protein